MLTYPIYYLIKAKVKKNSVMTEMNQNDDIYSEPGSKEKPVCLVQLNNGQ